MTSRKDYKAIAKIIKNNYDVSTPPVKFVLQDMTDQLAQYFTNDNLRFNRQKFVAACGMDGGACLYTGDYEPDLA